MPPHSNYYLRRRARAVSSSSYRRPVGQLPGYRTIAIRGLCQAAGDEEPAARVFARESSLLFILRADFEAHGLEGFDFPAIGKSVAQFGLRDASRSFRSRGGVTETKQEQTPAGVEDGLKPAHVVNAVRIGKNVKKA